MPQPCLLSLKTVRQTARPMSLVDAKFTSPIAVDSTASNEHRKFEFPLFPIELLAKQKSNFEKLTCAAISLISQSVASPRFDLEKNLKTQQKRQGRKAPESYLRQSSFSLSNN